MIYEKFEDIPRNKYKIIYADPPWSFDTYSDKGKDRSADKHYKTMSVDDMTKEFPMSEIADKDAVLLMWVTNPRLPDALDLARKLGFKYKTKAFNWTKECKKSAADFLALGYYTRANPEDCFLFTKGKNLKVQSRSVRQLQRFKVEEHSKKPDKFRELIVELFGDLPRIELFARKTCDGWDSFGNEVKGE